MNKNIVIDSLDTPNPIVAPQRDPVGYDTGLHSSTQRPRRRVPFTGVLAGAAVVGVACVGAWRFVGYLYNTNPMLQAVIDNGVLLVALVFFLFLAFAMLCAALYLQGWATERGITLLPGGMPIHNLDLLGGWKRETARAMAAQSVAMHFDVQGRMADQSKYRNVTNYAPSTSSSSSFTNNQQAAHSSDNDNGSGGLLPAPAPVPPFAALLDTDMIGLDEHGHERLVLGYDADTGEPLIGDIKSLYSAGIGGLQGSGKTWTASFILAQSALNKARFIIGDPHAGDKESLANRIAPLAPAFLCDIAESDTEILQALKYADSILKARKNGDPDRTPVIVAIDEWGSLRRGELADMLPGFIESFSTEGRKLACNVMLLSQRWDKNAVGDFRNTLTSQYVHRLRTDEARMLTGFRAASFPVDTLQLAPGTAYLVTTRGTITRVAIPEMSDAAMRRVGERLTTNLTTSTTIGARAMGFQRPNHSQKIAVGSSENSHNIAPDYSAAASAKTDTSARTPEQARILALFLDGKDAGAIVTELTGWNSKAGPKYMAKLAEVQAVIRAALAVHA